MIKVSDYSLNYSRQIADGKLTIFDFLKQCRKYDLEAASMHIRNLPSVATKYLKDVRRAYLDNGLSMSMFTVSTNFGTPRDGEKAELEKAYQAIDVGMFLGAPILRVFAGSPKNEADREDAFQRAVKGLRKTCVEAAEQGMTVGLQNHNHGALARTGEETLRFIREVNHPNFTVLLDTGQFAGSGGASGEVPPELKDADFMESIRMTAPLARHVRVKFLQSAGRRLGALHRLPEGLRYSAGCPLRRYHRHRLRAQSPRRRPDRQGDAPHRQVSEEPRTVRSVDSGSEEEPPPLGSWGSVYAAVLAHLAFWILLFYLFTVRFDPPS